MAEFYYSPLCYSSKEKNNIGSLIKKSIEEMRKNGISDDTKRIPLFKDEEEAKHLAVLELAKHQFVTNDDLYGVVTFKEGIDSILGHYVSIYLSSPSWAIAIIQDTDFIKNYCEVYE